MSRVQLFRYQLPIFFALAYGLTWTVQIPAYIYANAHGIFISNEDNLFHFQELLSGHLISGFATYLLLSHIAFGPSVAGIVVTALFKGRAGLRDLFRRVTRVRIPLRWVATILAIPFAWSLVALAFGLAGGFAPLDVDLLVPLSMVSATC